MTTTVESLREEINSLARDEDYAVNLVDLLIENSLGLRASDIHIESKRDNVTVKLRIDGEIAKSILVLDILQDRKGLISPDQCPPFTRKVLPKNDKA